MMEDRMLLWRLKRGNTDALTRIYDKYETYMLRLATGLLTNAEDAEDAVHDVFVKFAESAGRLSLRGNLRSFLATCVLNRSRDVIRRNRRRKVVALDDAPEPTGGDTDLPESAVMKDEQYRQLRHALGRLPDEQREVIVLRLNGGLGYKQIASLQQVSASTARGRYRYGLEKLRQLLREEASNEACA